jgi:hypothetical protein
MSLVCGFSNFFASFLEALQSYNIASNVNLSFEGF